MQTLLYDGSFEGWLSAVFAVYEYGYRDASICTANHFKGNMFSTPHIVAVNTVHNQRVLTGLQKKLSKNSINNLYKAFLSGLSGIEDVLLQYIRYVIATNISIEKDFSHPAVLKVAQTVKKVQREKHRMEAFVRFQKTADNLYYAIVAPDFNVLPLISDHFKDRYADQNWLIYDEKRGYGIYYNQHTVTTVALTFNDQLDRGRNIAAVYDADEQIYQRLWQQYFTSVNIAARKNTRLHIQHMPRRYWKFLPEKALTGL